MEALKVWMLCMILEGTETIHARRIGRETGLGLWQGLALGQGLGSGTDLADLTHHLLRIPLLESLSPVHEFKALICKQLLALGSQAIANDLIAAEEREQEQRELQEKEEASHGQGLEKSQGRYRTKTPFASAKPKKDRQENQWKSKEEGEMSTMEKAVIAAEDESDGNTGPNKPRAYSHSPPATL